MSASDNLSPEQFMFHATSRHNRDSIAKRGLLVEYDNGEGYTDPGVYLSPQISPHDTGHQDIWRVNTHGLELHDDPHADEGGGEKYTRTDITPDRLTLHRPGKFRYDEHGNLLAY